MLQYHIVDNPISSTPNAHMAQTVNVRSYDDAEIIELMLKRGTSLTRSDLLGAGQLRNEVILDLLEDGCGVNSALFVMSPSIPGVFDGPGDGFDSSRHRVSINIYPSATTRNMARKIKVEKVSVADPSPCILEVKDTVTGSVNELITPGGILELRGSRLKFLPGNPANGIFLMHESGLETRIEVVADNKPARLIALLPATVERGTCHVEVRTSFVQGSTKEGKQLRTGRFTKPLLIVG